MNRHPTSTPRRTLSRCGRFAVVATATIALAGSTMVATQAPAGAAWNGQCHQISLRYAATGFYNGWCDGRGPQTYRSVAECERYYGGDFGNNYWVYGPKKWFGDRGGSTALCTSRDRMITGDTEPAGGSW